MGHDVAVDGAQHGPPRPVQAEDERVPDADGEVPAHAAMGRRVQGMPAQAALADRALDEELGVGAHQPVVEHELDDGNAPGAQGVVHGGRDEGEDVLHDRHLGTKLAHQAAHLPPRAPGVQSLHPGAGLGQRAVALGLAAVAAVLYDFVAVIPQDPDLVARDRVLAALARIVVVAEKDSHVRWPRSPAQRSLAQRGGSVRFPA